MTADELSKVIIESANKVLDDNKETVIESIRQAMLTTPKENTAEAIGDLIGKSVGASINVSVSLSVAATLTTLAKLGFINLEIDQIYPL